MDLSTYKFPVVNKIDLAFSAFDTIPELLFEAEKRNPKKGMDAFDKLFFNGGQLKYQDDVAGTWKEKAVLYAIALMKSWNPKHEHKRLVVGMIFEECLILED